MTCMISTFSFMVAWIPYAVLGMLMVLRIPFGRSFSLFANTVAKTSCIYNTLILYRATSDKSSDEGSSSSRSKQRRITLQRNTTARSHSGLSFPLVDMKKGRRQPKLSAATAVSAPAPKLSCTTTDVYPETRQDLIKSIKQTSLNM